MANLLTYKTQEGQTFEVGVKAKHVPIENIQEKLNSNNVEDALEELATSIAGLSAGETIVGQSAKGYYNAGDYKTHANTWTHAFEQALLDAQTKAIATTAQYTTSTGSQNGATANPKVIAPTGVYEITRTITIPYGVDLELENVALKSTSPQTIANYDCFVAPAKEYRNHHRLPMFIGFRRCFAFSTANRDTSVVKFEGGGAINCKNFIDDMSYQMSRSTQLEIFGFVTVATHQPFRVHADDCHIHDGWIYASGHNVPVIFNQSRLRINNVIFIPKPTVEGDDNNMGWTLTKTYSEPGQMINYATGTTEDADVLSFDSQLPPNKLGIVGVNNRGITIEHCVFGGESGSMPTVIWEGVTHLNYSNSNALHNHISIKNCSIEAGNHPITQKQALVIIQEDLPSTMIFENLNGLSVAYDGLYWVNPSSTKHHGRTHPYEIYIGAGVRGRESFKVTNDSTTYPFITVPFRPNKAVATFKDLELAKNGEGAPYVPEPEEPEVPVEDREPIRYIRLGGNQPDGDFKIGELEVWHSGTNILADRQDWTVPEGTSRNLLPPVTDGVRTYSNMVSINNDSDRSKQYIQFDLNESYAEIEIINFLLYPSLAFNVFLQVSTNGTDWRTAYSNPSLNQSGDMLGTDVHANALYAI